MSESRIFCDVDFDKPGRQIAYLGLLHSDNVTAYGVIPVPLAVLANGTGPTVLLTSGNHGDEYEGQILLGRLIRELDLTRLSGRLIVMPALNYPAVVAATRVSPLDGGNMNRAFPGDPDGGPTAVIAHFVDSVVLPLCDAGIDLHSGGKQSRYVPSAYLCTHPDVTLARRNLELVEAFAAPLTLVVGASPGGGLDPVAHDRHGIPFISTELGGAGEVCPRALRIGHEGLERMLVQAGVLQPSVDVPAAQPTRFVDVSTLTIDTTGMLSTPVEGIFEPYCALGETVVEGQVIAAVHSLDDPARASAKIVSACNGVIYSQRAGAIVKRGGFVFQIAPEISRDEVVAGIEATSSQ